MLKFMLHFTLFITNKGEIIPFIQIRRLEVISFQAQGHRENKLDEKVWDLGLIITYEKSF